MENKAGGMLPSISLRNRILLTVYVLMLLSSWLCAGLTLHASRENQFSSAFEMALNEQFRIGNTVKRIAEAMEMEEADRLYYLAGIIRNNVIHYADFYADTTSSFRVSNEKGDVLYSGIPEYVEEHFDLSPSTNGKVIYTFKQIDNTSIIMVSSYVWIYDKLFRFDYVNDVSTMTAREIALSQKVSIVLAATTAVLLLVLYFSIKKALKPLKQLNIQARAMAEGSYNLRADVIHDDEVGQLARDFNNIAEAVEKHVETLSEAARLRELFAANLAHEIKTPITSIIGYADIAAMMDLEEDERHEMLMYISREGNRINRLSEKLLDWSRAETQKTADRKLCSSEKLVKHIRHTMEPVLLSRKQTLVIQNDTSTVCIDEPLMISVLCNLIQNASRASDEDQAVYLKLEYDSKMDLIIKVEDRGIGIEEEEQDKILEPFYTVDKARERKKESLGLGLALCKSIVTAHQGTLTVSSRPGEGTGICIWIPQDKNP